MLFFVEIISKKTAGIIVEPIQGQIVEPAKKKYLDKLVHYKVNQFYENIC